MFFAIFWKPRVQENGKYGPPTANYTIGRCFILG